MVTVSSSVFIGTQSHGSKEPVHGVSLSSAPSVMSNNILLAVCIPHFVRRIECTQYIIVASLASLRVVCCQKLRSQESIPAMSDSSRPELHLDEKWDRVINVMFSRSTMGLLAGTVAGFLLFRTFQSREPQD